MGLTKEQRRVLALAEPLDTPIVYHPGGWEDTIGEDIKREVIRQRLKMAANGGWTMATDAEIVCYLSTASLEAPLGGDWTDIFIHETGQMLPQLYQSLGREPVVLSQYQQTLLLDLKHKIRNAQLNRKNSKGGTHTMAKKKLVVEDYDGTVLVGVIQEGCDPHTETIDGTLEPGTEAFGQTLAAITQVIQRADEKWAATPKNPVYKEPAKPKPAAKPTAAKPAATPATTGATTPDLPLLSGTDKAQAETTEAAGQAPATEPEPAAPAAQEPAPATAPTEETPAGTEETDVAGSPVQAADETPAGSAPTEPLAGTDEPGATTEGKAEDAAAMLQDHETNPPSGDTEPAAGGTTTRVPGFYLQDGRGPFESVQAAMDAMGMDKDTRPHHNRWDRLSSDLKAKIIWQR